MNSRRRRVLICLTAGLAAFCSFVFLTSVSAQARAEREELVNQYGGDKTEVFIATRDIKPGETVERSDMEKSSWISSLLPQGALRDEREILGRKANALIVKGEPFISQRFGSDQEGLDLPRGFSALPLSVKQAQPFAGKVRAGDLLDIYATGQSGTHLLVRNARVGSWPEQTGQGSSPVSVVVFVPSERVQEVLEASHKTELSFVFSASSNEKDES